jgi:hypothetical protein
MKKLCLLMAMLVVATASLANTRDWKLARIVDSSETAVSGELRGKRNTMHYTIETEDRVYFADYTYKPDQHNNNRPPDIAANIVTKVAIEGRTAYVLDVNGKEVKLHIVKKAAQK